jgi:hypothetical protein
VRPSPDGGVTPPDGGPARECFSPTQNFEQAYDKAAVGCACGEPLSQICVGRAALVCERDDRMLLRMPRPSKWIAVEDGPCFPREPSCGGGEVRASATACLEDFTDCYQLPSGEFCGVRNCEPQDARYEPEALRCEFVPRYFWNGQSCVARGACATPCRGFDCERGFASADECAAAYVMCRGRGPDRGVPRAPGAVRR